MPLIENSDTALKSSSLNAPNTSLTGISVILPCYNEEEHVVKKGVNKVLKMLELLQVSHEVILVDDGSVNNTEQIIDRVIQDQPKKPIHKKVNTQNLGRGGAVMEGIKMSKYSVVGYLDIDLEISSHYIPSFYSAIKEGTDLVIAERIYKVQPTLRCLTRLILSKGYIWFSQFIIGVLYPDTEAGYKFFRRDKILPLLNKIQDTHWFWDTEVVIRAHDAGWKIDFLPCLFTRRKDKISSVRVFRDTFAYFKAILKFQKSRKKMKIIHLLLVIFISLPFSQASLATDTVIDNFNEMDKNWVQSHPLNETCTVTKSKDGDKLLLKVFTNQIPAMLQNKTLGVTDEDNFYMIVKARVVKGKEPYVAEPISLMHDGSNFVHLHTNGYRKVSKEGKENWYLYGDYNFNYTDVISPSSIPVDNEFHVYKLASLKGKLEFSIDGQVLNQWNEKGNEPLPPGKIFYPTILLTSSSDEEAVMEIDWIRYQYKF